MKDYPLKIYGHRLVESGPVYFKEGDTVTHPFFRDSGGSFVYGITDGQKVAVYEFKGFVTFKTIVSDVVSE